MANPILVPLDGSPVAELGLHSARRLARDSGATIHLMRTTMFFAGERGTYAEERRSLREAQEYLAGMEDLLRGQGLAVRSEVLPCDPVRGILFAAEAQGAGVISMSTHGRTGLSHALLGSVAEAVLRKSDTPVLMTRVTKQAQAMEPRVDAFGRILVALDGSRLSETSLDLLEREAIGANAEIELLRVVPRHPVPSLAAPGAEGANEEIDAGTDRHVHEAGGYLDKVGNARFGRQSWRAVVAVGTPCTEILDVASSDAAELIAVVTHGRQGVEKVLYGSVALDLLRHVEVPLLIVRGRQAEGDPRGSVPADARERGGTSSTRFSN
jgi:nucleotide-binding universal stress UspA family protein